MWHKCSFFFFLPNRGSLMNVDHKRVARWINSGDWMYSVIIRSNNTVLYTWNLLRQYIPSVLITHTPERELCEVMDVLMNLIVIIISQCILNHHIVHLEKKSSCFCQSQLNRAGGLGGQWQISKKETRATRKCLRTTFSQNRQLPPAGLPWRDSWFSNRALSSLCLPPSFRDQKHLDRYWLVWGHQQEFTEGKVKPNQHD